LGWREILRPAVALGGVAVAALLFAVALGLRAGSVAGPAASGLAATAVPTPSSTPGVGLWPRTGPVLAVPLDGPLLTAAVCLPILVAVLLLALLARGSLADARRRDTPELSWRGLCQIRSPRGWFLRALGIVLAVVLLVVGADLFQLSQNSPLVYGGMEGGPANMLGWRSGAGAGRFDEDGYVPFVPGGQFELEVSLRNDGDLPLTVTSFDESGFLAEQPAGAFISSVEVRLPPGPAYVDQGGYDQAFHPFELRPRDETSLALIVHLKDCRSVAPGPTAAPSQYSSEYLPTTGHVGFGEIPFRYSVLGIEREANVPLNVAMVLVFGSNAVTC
jgi:hypothetical protein